MGGLAVSVSVALAVLVFAQYSFTAKQTASLVVKINDYKEFKKYLRTHTNVFVIFTKSAKDFSTHETFNEVAQEVKGIASVVHVDCSIDKKLCKKLKVNPTNIQYKHFKDGEFHKSYDRNLVTKSIVKFLRNPTGDIPWDEEQDAGDVVHVEKKAELFKIISKEKKPILAMFYAPWCGHCKKLKPDFAAAATALKGKYVLLGMDVDTTEGGDVRVEFNITGFPTIIYFKDGKREMDYGGTNTKEGIIEWMNNPQPPKQPEKEEDWSEEESDVVHLTDETFHEVVSNSSSALVMFYAPWCGHCKKMKPEYQQAAAIMKEQNIPGILAAVDATKHSKVANSFSIKGFPTVKYFKDGKEQFDNYDRTRDSIVAFMKDPKEPPPPPPEDLPWRETPSYVEHLDEGTFKNFIKKKKHTLVIFYAPWCGHCQKAKPEFMAAAEEFKDDPKVTFAAVDCTKNKEMCQENGVAGYPTFKYFSYGKSIRSYDGGREKDDFVQFINNPRSSPTAGSHWDDIPGHEVISILKADNFESFIRQHETVVVTFYGAACTHCQSMRKDFVEAANFLKKEKVDVQFAAVDVVTERILSSSYGIIGLPTIKFFRNGMQHLEYEGPRTKEEFINLVNNPPPVVTLFKDFPSENVIHLTSEEKFDELLQTKERLLVFFHNPSTRGSVESRPEFWRAAENVWNKKFQLATVDCEAYYSLCKKHSVSSYPKFKLYVGGKFDSDYDTGEAANWKSLSSFISKEVSQEANKESTKVEL